MGHRVSNYTLTIEPVYTEPGFIQVIEDNLNIIRTNPNNRVVFIRGNVLQRNMYDLYTLMRDLNIPAEYHYVTMRINGYESPSDFDSTKDHILTVDRDIIDELMSVYRTRN